MSGVPGSYFSSRPGGLGRAETAASGWKRLDLGLVLPDAVSESRVRVGRLRPAAAGVFEWVGCRGRD